MTDSIEDEGGLMKSTHSATYIIDCTVVSPIIIFLCGLSTSTKRKSKTKHEVLIDTWIRFKASELHAVLLRKVQSEVEYLFSTIEISHNYAGEKIDHDSDRFDLNNRTESILRILQSLFLL